ncbi:MAG: hypothetical protein ACXV5R_13190 [Candidatus Angelobacter sp.]
MRVAIACAMLLAFFGPSVMALVKDGPVPPPASASTPASASDSAAPASPALVATALPDAPPPVTSVTFTNPEAATATAFPAPPAALIKLKTQPRTHSFFDARNTLGLASLGMSLTADALSTQKGLAYPGFTEMNPIARPFVQSRMGAAVYNAGSFGLLAGMMYWAHKTQHHKLERILPFAVGGWEGLLSARNYQVIANRAR